MAIIMLAIGSLLAAVGLYAIVSGYPMIEIERGWASVIAGSVLLSGGLVIVALGFVLRALARLRVAMVAQPLAAPASAEPRFPSFVATAQQPSSVGATLPALAVAAPAAAVALAEGHDLWHDAPMTAPAEHETPPAPALDAPELHGATLGASEPFDAPEESWDERAVSAFDGHVEPEVHAPPAEPALAEYSEAHAPPLPDEHPKFADEAATEDHEYEHEHEPEPDVHEELHHEPPADHAELQPHPVAAAEPPEHEHGHDIALHAEPAVEAPATAPESPPANLAVIGRYDSEGTSYVMYSDGSIEAQSEAGIYRFNSMAELKAFIEG